MMPKLLFLPGAGGDPTFWHPLGERLPPQWTKRYFGWPGLGAQPHDPAIRGLDDLAALVEAELDQPCDLVAQSMGGIVAMRLALRHPGRIRRIVLTATSGGVDISALGGADWREDYLRNFPTAARWITEARADHTPDLARVTAPVLLLWSDSDPISPVAVGEHLARLLPHATLHVIPGGDHGFANNMPEAIAGLVERFLA